MMSSLWPCEFWGIDLIGPLPVGKGGVKYAIMAMDYFTKWTEAEPLASIKTKKSLDFVIKNIVCRFGLPRKIVSDNRTQFESNEFTNFHEQDGIIKSFSSVAHPQGNGQVEAVNKTLKDSIKKRLEGAKGSWPKELPNVLWAYRLIAHTSTGHRPFALTYRCKAMFPVKMKVLTHLRDTYDLLENRELLEESLDLIEEKRARSQLLNASYRQRMTRYFNKKVRDRQFTIDDLVLRHIFLSIRYPRAGVLRPNWEGPYEIKAVIRPGVYKLVRLARGFIPQAWNAEHLRKYYQ